MKQKYTMLKSLVCVALFACIATVISPEAKADVYESNYDPSVILDVTYRAENYQYNWYYDRFVFAGQWENTVSLYNGDSLYLWDYYSDYDIWLYSTVFTYYRPDPSYNPGGGGGGGGTGDSVAKLSLVGSSGYQFLPADLENGESFTFFNAGNETITFQALNGGGGTLGSQVQWHVTDLVNDSVTHDWVTSPSLTLSDLWGKALRVLSRASSGSIFSVEISFADGSYAYGAAGDPNKVRSDNSFPYGQERIASCSVGALRNVLHIKGKPVPSEDVIIQVLAQNGKPQEDFTRPEGSPGGGMGFDEAEARFNQVLGPYNLNATRQNGISREDVEARLNAGETLIVGVRVSRGDLFDPNNRPRLVPHMIVMHGIGSGKVEVLDPGDGTRKVETVGAALSRMRFFSNITGEVWEITP